MPNNPSTDIEAGELMACPTCGATNPNDNEYCSSSFHAKGPTYWPLDENNCPLPAPSTVSDALPIPMILFCPKCGLQHIDAPDDRTPDWTNPPHKSHLCHGCGCIWRPADVPTEGVAAIQSRGSKDSIFYNQAALAMQSARTPDTIGIPVDGLDMLCEDEGCPQYPTEHVCVTLDKTLIERAGRAILAVDDGDLLSANGYPEIEAEKFAKTALTAIAIPSVVQERELLTKELRALAVALHRSHYHEVTQWRPLDEPRGILSQIDNMTAGMGETIEMLRAEINQQIRRTLPNDQ